MPRRHSQSDIYTIQEHSQQQGGPYYASLEYINHAPVRNDFGRNLNIAPGESLVYGQRNVITPRVDQQRDDHQYPELHHFDELREVANPPRIVRDQSPNTRYNLGMNPVRMRDREQYRAVVAPPVEIRAPRLFFYMAIMKCMISVSQWLQVKLGLDHYPVSFTLIKINI